MNIMVLMVIKTFLISHFIIKFEPIQWVLDLIKIRIKNNNIIGNLIMNILTVLTTCHKCSALWIGLLLYGLWPALITSYIAHIYSWRIDPIIEKIILPNYGEENK